MTNLKQKLKKILPIAAAVLTLTIGVSAVAEGTRLIQVDENNVWVNKQSKGSIHYTSEDGEEFIFDSSDLDVLATAIKNTFQKDDFIIITQEDYDALVTAGTVDLEKIYLITSADND